MISNPRHGSPPRLMAHQPTSFSTTQESSIRVHRPDPVSYHPPGVLGFLTDPSTPQGEAHPCHSPSEQRWFQLRVSRLEHAGETYAVVAHHDISKRILAEQERQ